MGYVWCEICVGYVWCEIRQQSSEEPCDETSFGKKLKKSGLSELCLHLGNACDNQEETHPAHGF